MKVGNRSGLSTQLSEINVTPLVDVMLVLLIIFMVAAPMMQSGITIQLPTSDNRNDEATSGLVLTITKDHYIYLQSDKTPINLFLLESKLQNYFVGRPKKVVFIRADKQVSYGYVVSVMDVIKKAGIETIGMIVEEKKGRSG